MKLGLIGGMDPTGGAGLLRDAWTTEMIAPDLEIRCVATTLTRQGGDRAATSYPVPPEQFEHQLAALDEVSVLKLGVLPATLAEPFIAWQEGRSIPVVLDPVLHATDGGALGGQASTYARCCGSQTLITPNVYEARRLAEAPTLEGEPLAAAVLEATDAGMVLLKGGHAPSEDTVVDHLLIGSTMTRFERRWCDGPEIRGTGCALGAAIASSLTLGRSVPDAVRTAIQWLDEARTMARKVADGRWHLPSSASGSSLSERRLGGH